MKTKVVAALAFIMALVIVSCSDNNEDPVVPPKQSYTLAKSYVMPTSMKVADDSQIKPEDRPIAHPGINFMA